MPINRRARSWVERAWPAPQPPPAQALTVLSPMAYRTVGIITADRHHPMSQGGFAAGGAASAVHAES